MRSVNHVAVVSALDHCTSGLGSISASGQKKKKKLAFRQSPHKPVKNQQVVPLLAYDVYYPSTLLFRTNFKLQVLYTCETIYIPHATGICRGTNKSSD